MKKFLYVAILALGVVVMMAPPVMAQDEKPFTLHGEVRFRGEYDANTSDFDDDGVAGGDDGGGFWPYRVRIAAEGHFTKNVSAWLEFQNAGVAGNIGAANSILGTPSNNRGGSDFFGLAGSNAELYQGNITIEHLWWKNFTARIGRQEIMAGNELMLGDLDFYAGLTHDGMTGNFKVKKGSVMLFFTRPTQGAIDTFGAGFLPPDQISFTGSGLTGFTSTTTNFYGVYTNWDVKLGTLDAYALDLKSHGGAGVDFDVTTLGVRWGKDNANKKGLFWNVEVATQSGDAMGSAGCGTAVSVTSCDAGGTVTEGWIGWNFKSGKNTHRVYAKLEAASGDDSNPGSATPSTTDTDEDGFIPMFGDFHNRLGHGDWFQLSGVPTFLGSGVGDAGIQGTALGWTGMFGDRHEIGAELWQYNTGEDVALSVGTGTPTSDKIGNAIDVWYAYNYSKNLMFSAALSQLSPDEALTDNCGALCPDDSVTRLYGNARFRF